MMLAGGVVLVFLMGSMWEYGFASAIGAGLSLLLLKAAVSLGLLSVLARWAAGGDGKRQREDEAKRYLEEHGASPDEQTHERAMRRNSRSTEPDLATQKELRGGLAATPRIPPAAPETR